VENTGLYLGSLDAAPDQQSLQLLQPTMFSVGYTMGHILFLRDGTLMAQAFDERKLQPTGDAVVVAEQIATNLSRAAFSVSPKGILSYRNGSATDWQFTWYDREGRVLGHEREQGMVSHPALSPDGTRIAYTRVSEGKGHEVWMIDLARGTKTRLSFAPEGADSPAWSPDGKRVAFSSYVVTLGGNSALYVKEVASGKPEEAVLRSNKLKYMNGWSRDGRSLLFTQISPENARYSLWAIAVEPAGSDRQPASLGGSGFNELQGQVSPDSRWLAYTSNLSGKYEIYVRPFPPAGRTSQWLVSNGGGDEPRWRGDGKELFYHEPDGKLMAVNVTSGSGDESFQMGAPHELFTHTNIGESSIVYRYDVSADGKRFLLQERMSSVTDVPATVVVNWEAGMSKK